MEVAAVETDTPAEPEPMVAAAAEPVVATVAEIAAARGDAPAQIALAWVLRQPGIAAPIIGASKMPQLEQAIGALEIALTDEEAARLEEPYVPHGVLGH